jgi:hypothetical protein
LKTFAESLATLAPGLHPQRGAVQVRLEIKKLYIQAKRNLETRQPSQGSSYVFAPGTSLYV